MPRYFFQVLDGRGLADVQGTELDDVATARLQAVRYAGSILGMETTTLADGEPWRMNVVDEAGETVFALRFEADRKRR